MIASGHTFTALLLFLGLPLRDARTQEPTRGFLAGRVSDSAGAAIPFANVQLNGVSTVVANENGEFRVRVPIDRSFVIDVRRIGFQPARLNYAIAPDSGVRILLAPIAQRLETMKAVGRQLGSLVLNGFYERIQQSRQGTLSGYFITPEDIERRTPSRASQMLDQVPSIRVKMIPPGLIDGRQPPPFAAFGSDGCLATIYVNGTRQNLLAKTYIDELRSAVFDDVVEPGSLAAIEVYTRGTRAPAAYQALNGSCAVVVIWTK